MEVSKNLQEKALEVLRLGGLVVYPTDTVYGLLVDAENQSAVSKLIAFKQRPRGKPISVFVSDFRMMDQVVNMDEKTRQRLGSLLPGRYTIVLKSKGIVCAALESEQGTLGIRIPQYKPVNDLVASFARPLTATSANRSGRASVHSIAALMNQLNDTQKQMLDYVVDVGTLPPNKPSTVIDLTGDNLKILRAGDFVFSSSRSYVSASPADTMQIAQTIMKEQLECAEQSVTVILQGDLGAGKTHFAKGIAQGLGVKDSVISPTYVVLYEYNVPVGRYKHFVHMDLYNIQSSDEFKELGIEQYLQKPSVLCIEWGERAGELLEDLKKRSKIIHVELKYVSETQREITCSTV